MNPDRRVLMMLKSFRLSVELAGRLNLLARATRRSERSHVEAALRSYLEGYNDAQIAKDRFNNPKSVIVSSKEFRNRIGDRKF